MNLKWVTQGTHEEAQIIIGGLMSAKLVVARDGSWALVGSQGRKPGAKAASMGHAKLAALEALRQTLQTAIGDIDAAMRV